MHPMDSRFYETHRLEQERWMRHQKLIRQAQEAHRARTKHEPDLGLAQRVMHWLGIL